MNAMLILLVSIVVLVLGYIFYGGWLAKQWGVKADRTTPAHEFEDGRDYVPAPPYVVLGHHFSSIAGAGPINGPIQAAIFGWVPVLLWVLIGGIFIGAMHDFGALFASLRHKGQTLATVIQENVDGMAKKLFCIFAYLTLILVVAAFASIVASTFAVAPVPADAAKAATVEMTNLANTRTAMISMLFIVVAVVFGLATRGRKIPTAINVISAIVIIVLVVTLGFLFPVISLDNTTWMIIIGIYILLASVAPVWILLQPRDYLSSYLLYGMIALALVGIVGSGIVGGSSDLSIPRSPASPPLPTRRRLRRAVSSSRHCSSPSPVAPYRASIALWPRVRRPNSSIARVKRNLLRTVACCSSVWSPSFRCAPWRSCSRGTWMAPTPRPRRSSRRAFRRCSA